MNVRLPRGMYGRFPLVALTLILLFATGFAGVNANVLGMADRFNVWQARIGAIIDPPPHRPTLPTVIVTPEPNADPTPAPTLEPTAELSASPTPSATPLVREPVNVTLVEDQEEVFASQLTDKDCAVAATQMVLAILGLGDTSDAFQQEIKDRIGKWEAWEDSQNGGWGRAAVGLALDEYGATGYEVRAYDSYMDAPRLRYRHLGDGQASGHVPVVGRAHVGHDWLPRRYGPDRLRQRHDLRRLHPRSVVSALLVHLGASDPPGNFEDLTELERNWPVGTGRDGWSRPEGAYPDRDGRFMVLIPTTPRD